MGKINIYDDIDCVKLVPLSKGYRLEDFYAKLTVILIFYKRMLFIYLS